MYVCIYPQNIWGIGNYADNYIDGSSNLSAILKLIHPLTFYFKKKIIHLYKGSCILYKQDMNAGNYNNAKDLVLSVKL
jgi:hypothetical protein